MIDYLQKIRTADNLEDMATYVRARATRVVRNLSFNYSAQEIYDIIEDYENDANIVLESSNVEEARQYLAKKGYGC